MIMHKSITASRVLRLAQADDYTGICVACGKTAVGVEPDARKYTCTSCGKPAVYGAEELLLSVA